MTSDKNNERELAEVERELELAKRELELAEVERELAEERARLRSTNAPSSAGFVVPHRRPRPRRGYRRG
jgi:hypothetical protein